MKINNRSWIWGALAAVVVMGGPTVGLAMAPPVDFALEATGEASDERWDSTWSMTRLDAGIAQFCGDRLEDDGQRQGWSFSDDERKLEISADSDGIWGLVWAVLWSQKPHRSLAAYTDDWSNQSGRVESFDGGPVYCYGHISRLCVDDRLGHIAVVDVDVDDGQRWGLRVTGDGQRVRVTVDGSTVARLTSDGC